MTLYGWENIKIQEVLCDTHQQSNKFAIYWS